MTAMWGGLLVTVFGCGFVGCTFQAMGLVSREEAQLLAELATVQRPVVRTNGGWPSWLRRAPSVASELPVVLDSVARNLRLGSSLRQALEGATAKGALGNQLDVLNRDLILGTSLVVAIERWRQSAADPLVDLVAGSLLLSVEAGGSLGSAVEQVAATVRDRAAVAAEVHALASQARLSAVVIALMPVGFVVIAAVSDPEAARFLIESSLGRICIVGGIGLDAAGLWWMHKIVRSITW